MISLTDFLNSIPKITKSELPGLKSQLKMAAVERLDEMRLLALENRKTKKAAVVMLCYPKQDEMYFALIERVISGGTHSGQIAFPGGKIEENESALQAAIRETKEEVGIILENQHVLLNLTSLYIPPSNYEVFPYLAFLESEKEFQLQPTEVENIIEIKLTDLLNDVSIKTMPMKTKYMEVAKVPYYHLNNQVVWGATAMILAEVKEILNAALTK